ncbi:MAG TPA: hypothetical protein VNS63_05440 [Blastocatellia bacterium]|nr:hypothetical protein [Blastocatellia bacterium]
MSDKPDWDTHIPGIHPAFIAPITQAEIEAARQSQPFAKKTRGRRPAKERELDFAVLCAPDPITDPDGALIYQNDGGTRIYEGELDDPQLGLLLKLGMPHDRERMLARCPGINYGHQFADYSIELFGISLDDLVPDEVFTGAIGGKPIQFWPQTLERRLLASDGGREKYFGVWLTRIRCAKTPMTLEQAWLPQRGWKTIMDLQHLPVAAQKIGWKILTPALSIPVLEQGAIFPAALPAPGGRPLGSGDLDHLSIDDLRRHLAYFMAYCKRNNMRATQEEFALLFGDKDRVAIWRRLKTDGVTWDDLRTQATRELPRLKAADIERWCQQYEHRRLPELD